MKPWKEKQTIHILKNKIPVYITTAWVDDRKINFYNDLYQRDDRLADLLFCWYRIRLLLHVKESTII
jgi:murein L,D-transpeptidase YcbB/YkuD